MSLFPLLRPATLLAALAFLALPVVFLGAAPLPAQEQSTTLVGQVQSADDGSGVASAAVRIPALGSTTFSDASGRFRLAAIPVGRHQLEISRIGYRTTSLEVTIEPGRTEPLSVEIRLVPDPVLLAGLVASVSGELQRRAETPASVSSLSGQAIREVNPSHPAEIMNRIPGVWVSPTSTEGHMTAIRQPITTKPVYLFLEDGVPTRSPGFFNHNALYEVNVPQSDRIEVIRGPGTSLYGSDAIGGVIDVGTRPSASRPEFEAVAEGSSLGFGRFLATASDSRGDNGLRLDLNITDGDSWRDDAGYDRRSATLRWDRTLGSGMSLRTTATWSRIDQYDPSVVSREELETDPSVNYHPITFRFVEAVRVASRFERRRDGSTLEVTPYLRWNSLDLMPPWMLNFDPVVYETGHSSIGLMVRHHLEVAPLRGRLTAGIDLDRSPGERVEDRISITREQGFARAWERLERLYDYEATFIGISPYLQLATNPIEPLFVTAGLRYDRVGFDYRSALEPLQTGSHRRPADTEVRYSNLGPSIGAALTLDPAANLFASFRESFRSPSEGQLFRQGAAESTVTLRPVRARNLEGGIRGELAERLGYELSLFRLEVRDDILSFIRPEDGLRESLNAGRTLHRGVEAGLSASLPAGLAADVTLTRASHRYIEWMPRADEDYSGNLMEQAPRDLASARLRAPLPLLAAGHLELEWVRMGEFWMDPRNENLYEGHDLWNLRFEAPIIDGVTLQGRILNLADRAYAERASFNAFRGEELSPGKPRALHLGLRWRWQ